MKLKNKIYALVWFFQLVLTTSMAQTWTPNPINYQVYEWAKSFGGIEEDVGYALTVDASGNTYVTGLFEETVDFNPGIGIHNLAAVDSHDIFISKFDAAGNFVWAKQVGSTASDSGYAIVLDDQNNLYITGSFFYTADFDPGPGIHTLTSEGNYDIFILKLDTNGNFIWAKNMGGPEADMGFSIALDGEGNIYTTGYFSDTADFDPGVGVSELTAVGERDIFISKLDNSGNFMAVKGIGGTGLDEGNAITLDASGNIYTTGFFEDVVDFDPGPGMRDRTSAGDKDVFILRLNDQGNFVGAKQIGGPGEDVGNSLVLDSQNNICTTGYFEETVDFNPNFATHNLTSAGFHDIFVLKLTSSGLFLGAVKMGGESTDKGNCITLDASDNMYITGSFEETVDFDPGSGVYELRAAVHSDIFISKLEDSGKFRWAYKMGAGGLDSGHGIAVDNDRNVFTTGEFNLTVDFDPGPGVDQLTAQGDRDIFLQKLGNTITNEIDRDLYPLVSFPNPTSEHLNIDLGQFYSTFTVKVMDFSGALLSTEKYRNKEQVDISISGAPGIYFVKVIDEGGESNTLKIIKE